MSNATNEILMENLFEEGLEEGEKQGLTGIALETFAEQYAIKKIDYLQ